MENQWSSKTGGAEARLPESPRLPMEFLSRSWSASALQVINTITPPPSSSSTTFCNPLPPSCCTAETTLDDLTPPQASDEPLAVSGNAASPLVSSQASHFLLERIMSERTLSFSEISPLTSGRPSHSSGPLIGESPRLSPSQKDVDDVIKVQEETEMFLYAGIDSLYCAAPAFKQGFCATPQFASVRTAASPAGGSKSVGRWLKERREKKKEETRTQNAQLHAAISVAGVAAAVAAMAAATANSGKTGSRKKTDLAVASAATLVAAQCVEAAEIVGADREQLSAVIGSAVNIKCHDDIVTLTAAAATALRGAATLRARAVKEIQNAASVTPVENFMKTKHSYSNSSSSHSGELITMGLSPSPCNLEFLAKGYELLKRTRKGDLHWKIVSVYIHRTGEVMLKMKSKHVKGTITQKKKNVVVEVLKHLPMWPGRHLLEDADQRRCFGLRTITRGIVEFECKTQQEHDIWTEGVIRLLSVVSQRKRRHQV